MEHIEVIQKKLKESGYYISPMCIYQQLQYALDCKIEPAPDEWDRLYNVDFYIEIKGKYIGLQIKPINQSIQLPEIYKEYSLQHNTHKEFTSKYQGNVFYIFSQKVGDKKEIVNKEVIDDIKTDIQRLKAI
ncbi:MAG: MjaI family restriction endonuclease [Agathobacter sp.]